MDLLSSCHRSPFNHHSTGLKAKWMINHRTDHVMDMRGRGCKAMSGNCCNPDKMGYSEYRCQQCGQGTHRVAMSCKSSLCLRCAKVHVDNWVSQVSKALHEGVIYRHIILTVPAMFRTTFYHNAAVVLSAFIRCGAQCLDDFYSTVRGKALKGGSITVLH